MIYFGLMALPFCFLFHLLLEVRADGREGNFEKVLLKGCLAVALSIASLIATIVIFNESASASEILYVTLLSLVWAGIYYFRFKAIRFLSPKNTKSAPT